MEGEKANLPTPALARLELVAAVLLTILAAGFSIFMDRLVAQGGMREAQEFIRLTPVFFPRLAFGVMAVLAAIHTVRAYRQLASTAPPSQAKWTDTYQNVIIITVLLFLYAWLLSVLGFTAATFVGIAAVTFLLGSRKWHEILPISLLAPLVIRFVFERLLLISLPRSIFEFVAVPEETLMKFLTKLFFFFRT